jgi:hypothetical protein
MITKIITCKIEYQLKIRKFTLDCDNFIEKNQYKLGNSILN